MARGFEVTTGLVIQQGLFEDSSTSKHKLGTRMQLADGRVFYYAKNTATTGVAGNAQECLPAVANHTNVNMTATYAVGATVVSIESGGTVAAVNQYREGWFFCTEGDGMGHAYKIKSNVATSGSSGDNLVITLYDPLRVGLTAGASSQGSAIYNPYYGLKIATTEANNIMGVMNYIVTSAYYYWLQTWGPTVVLGSAAVSTIGEPLTAHGTNGSVGYNFLAITSQGDQTVRFPYAEVGTALGQITVSAEYTPIFLRCSA